ncbi:HYR-like domain-containing protein, partial [Mangrovimonas spongiae]
MKTSAFKNKLLKIATCLMLLVGSNIYGQIANVLEISNVNCVPDPNANCTSSSVKILGAFIGDENGVPLTSDNVANYDANDDFYVYAQVDATGNKFDLFIQFTLIKYLNDGTRTETLVEAHASGSTVDGNYQVNYPIPGYVLAGEINSLYGLEDILLTWDNTDDNTPTCPNGNYSACNGTIPDQIAVGPFLVVPQFDPISCFGDTTDVTLIAGGGNSPYTFTYLNNNTNATATNSTGIFSNLPAGNYTFTSTDSSNPQREVIQNITINQPTQVENTVNAPTLSCSTGTTTVTFTASGGTPPYTYVDNGNTTGGTSSWNSSTNELIYTGVSEGSIFVSFFDANGCVASNNITIEAVDQTPPSITAPDDYDLQGCDVSVITDLPYNDVGTSITLAELQSALGGNGNASDDNNIDSITYIDTQTGTCPIIVERTFTVSDGCSSSEAVQYIEINQPMFTVPASETETVDCLADAVQPTAPVVADACGNDITPVITENADPACEGAKVYTFTYTDCANNEAVYTYTYNIELPAFTVPASETETVDCLADAVQPTAPVVADACGNDITPVITENADPACEGAKVYTFTYTDCANNEAVYTYTYNIELPAFTVPASETETVDCLADAVQPTAPVVADACGNDITPVITENADPACEGAKVYTFTYTDCANNEA